MDASIMSAKSYSKEVYSAKPLRFSLLLSNCTWLKRIGVAGFFFFLIKGLLWLLIPSVLVYFGIN